MGGSNGKVVVITGATRGLGRAMVEHFAAQGCRVIGCGRTAGGIAALRSEHGDAHVFDAVDVTDDAAVAAWAGQSIARFGPPDLLLNSAALINHVADLWAVPRDEFDRMIDVNIKGVANVLRHFVPAMIDRGSGVIVNFSSGWGRGTAPQVAPYCATKWAIEGLTRALSQELPRGLAAATLNPGVINTDMLQTCWGRDAQQYEKPRTWAARAVPFLLSLDASCNGQALTAP